MFFMLTTLFKDIDQRFPEASTHLKQLWAKGTKFLGCPLGILGGAMTWVSEPSLVSAISNAGGFGVLASGAMSPDILKQIIRQTQKKTSHPFGVNLILLHPQVGDLIDVCIQCQITHVVLAAGIPNKDQLKRLIQAGIQVIAFAPTLAIAKRLERIGVGALVIEGTEAGGHVGPVSSSVLAQEILPHPFTIPIFIAGGIGHGSMILKYLEMGASGCQLGTRFVCAQESVAHPLFKQAFIRASARDATLSAQVDARFPVIPVRALENDGCEAFRRKQQEVVRRFEQGQLSQKEAQLEIEHFWAGGLRRAVLEGDTKMGSLMAGQSVGFVRQEEPVEKIIWTLLKEACIAYTSNTSLSYDKAVVEPPLSA
jgi:enoyl-[acyl-carrier protein] reductase II